MKKIFCVLLCILMVATLFGCGQENIASVPTTQPSQPVSTPPATTAPKPETPVPTSTIKLTDEEIQKYGDGTEDYVLRIYYALHKNDLFEGKTVEEVASAAGQYFAVIKHEKVSYFGFDAYDKEERPAIDYMWRYIVQPQHVFGMSVKVYDVFCVAKHMTDSAAVSIYYFTDQGTYVLYREQGTSDELFFMTMEEYLYLIQESREINACHICLILYGREQYPFTPIRAARASVEKLVEGMSYEEVVNALGVPETCFYGDIYCWKLDDGQVLVVFFGHDENGEMVAGLWDITSGTILDKIENLPYD